MLLLQLGIQLRSQTQTLGRFLGVSKSETSVLHAGFVGGLAEETRYAVGSPHILESPRGVEYPLRQNGGLPGGVAFKVELPKLDAGPLVGDLLLLQEAPLVLGRVADGEPEPAVGRGGVRGEVELADPGHAHQLRGQHFVVDLYRDAGHVDHPRGQLVLQLHLRGHPVVGAVHHLLLSNHERGPLEKQGQQAEVLHSDNPALGQQLQAVGGELRV